jgi:hypothetical protein
MTHMKTSIAATVSKSAKNWPSTLFGQKTGEHANSQEPLCLLGLSKGLARLNAGQLPSDYELPALTTELWVQHASQAVRHLFRPLAHPGQAFSA